VVGGSGLLGPDVSAAAKKGSEARGVSMRIDGAGNGTGNSGNDALACELARVDGFGDILCDTERTAGRVDEPRALLHVRERLLVDDALGSLVQRAVERDNVALREEVLEVLDAASTDLLGGVGGQLSVIEILQGDARDDVSREGQMLWVIPESSNAQRSSLQSKGLRRWRTR